MSIIEIIAAFFTSHGAGGITVILVMGLAALIYYVLIRWILRGEELDKTRTRDRNR